MSQQSTVESRLTQLEEQVARLRQQMNERHNTNWLQRMAGSMANEPEFEEVLRLGQAARQADKLDP